MEWEKKLLWLRQDFQAGQKAFWIFANNQPEEIRLILYRYAESGRMMEQRLAILACMYLDGPEET